eukprot:TRINITY_DN555_c0_g5_i1.p1 TRINITY_DN555_c0_g5~~TRINITY_DN555_c0_g5_i1.p1  ORF type:complete len:668 (+),score=102.39 TRINITY_DN555_c0_g5_i1:232-2235(+)
MAAMTAAPAVSSGVFVQSRLQNVGVSQSVSVRSAAPFSASCKLSSFTPRQNLGVVPSGSRTSMAAEAVADKPREGAKEPGQETLLTPRFYTTDIDEMERKTNPVVAEIFTLMSRDEARHAGQAVDVEVTETADRGTHEALQPLVPEIVTDRALQRWGDPLNLREQDLAFLDCDDLGELQEDFKELTGDLMVMVERGDTDALRELAGANLEAVEEQMGNGMGVGVQQAGVLNVLARAYMGLGLPEAEYTLWKASELASKVDLEEFASVELPGVMTPFDQPNKQGYEASLHMCHRCLQTMQSIDAPMAQQLVVVQHIFFLHQDAKAFREGIPLQQEYLQRLEEHRERAQHEGERPLPLHLVIRLQVNLATLFAESGAMKEAEELFQRVDPLYAEAYPRNVLHWLRFQTSWVAYRVATSDFVRSEELLLRGIWRQEGGDRLRDRLFQHATGVHIVAGAGLYLAQAQMSLNKKTEAEASLQSVLACVSTFYGADSPFVVDTLTQLAAFHHMREQWGSAAKYFRKALEILRKEGEEGPLQYTHWHKTVPYLVHAMAMMRKSEGNSLGAEVYARELVEVYQQRSPKNVQDIVSALQLLAQCLMERRAWKEAESELLLSLSLLLDSVNGDRTSPVLLQPVLALMQVYAMQNKRKESKVHKQWLENICAAQNIRL